MAPDRGGRDARERDRNHAARLPFEEQQFDGEQADDECSGDRHQHHERPQMMTGGGDERRIDTLKEEKIRAKADEREEQRRDVRGEDADADRETRDRNDTRSCCEIAEMAQVFRRRGHSSLNIDEKRSEKQSRKKGWNEFGKWIQSRVSGTACPAAAPPWLEDQLRTRRR